MTATSVFDQLPLEQLEEASGELHRRAGAALRQIGELRAEDADGEGVSPRARVAALVVSSELAAAALSAIAAGTEAPRGRIDLDRTVVAALMYGAPSLDGLLGRLEQNRRMLASLARHLEPRLDELVDCAWGELSLRQVMIEHAISEPARCAQALDKVIAGLESEQLAAAQASDE